MHTCKIRRCNKINCIHTCHTIYSLLSIFLCRFSPEEKAKRHPCAYLPFGLGPRNCVGMRFALLQAKLTLFEVVRNFKIELSPKTKVRVTNKTPIDICIVHSEACLVNSAADLELLQQYSLQYVYVNSNLTNIHFVHEYLVYCCRQGSL